MDLTDQTMSNNNEINIHLKITNKHLTIALIAIVATSLIIPHQIFAADQGWKAAVQNLQNQINALATQFNNLQTQVNNILQNGAPIPDGSITTAKLADGAATNPKIASGSIDSSKIASSFMKFVQLLDDANGNAKGWTPGTTGAGTFTIIDAAVQTNSIVAINLDSHSTSFENSNICAVFQINPGSNFVFSCDSAPPAGDTLNYAIITP